MKPLPRQSAEERIFESIDETSARPITLTTQPTGTSVARGRRIASPGAESGRYVRAIADPEARDIAVAATLRTAAARGLTGDGRLAIQQSDLRRKVRESQTGALLLFIVDASGSMAARQRMEAVKGAVMALLKEAYHQRDRVAVIAFRGPEAELLLPPTASVERAREALRTLPTGGRTPLAHGLLLATDLVEKHLSPNGAQPVLAIVITDGKANVSLPGTQEDPWQQALSVAAQMARGESAGLVLDPEHDFIRHHRARQLADALGAEYLPLDDLTSDSVVLEVRKRREFASSKS